MRLQTVSYTHLDVYKRQELFKDSTTGGGCKIEHLSPYAAGGFSVSYIAFNTLFQKSNPNEVSETFKRFQDYRLIMSQRVAAANPYWNGQNSACLLYPSRCV